jgi:2-keto-4-pentenoate hydratase
VIEAARLLLNARGDFRRLRGFPESCRPEDMDDAYLIQQAFAEEWELPVSGYKIGCTAKDQQKMLGVKEPFYGRIFAPFLRQSPTELSAGAFQMLGLESEFAFRLKAAIKPRKAPYTRADVEKKVGAFHPAIELVDSRLDDWIGRGPASIVADNGANGALVIGEPVREWRKHDLAKLRVKLTLDGAVVGRGTGRRALGHPLEALTWLANALTASGITLERDQIVTTGTVTGIHFAEAGSTAVADFGPLGQVQVGFTA